MLRTNEILSLVRAGAELLNWLGEAAYNLGESWAFRRRNPFQVKTLFFESEVGQHQAESVRSFLSLHVAVLVVAVAGMTAAHEDAVGALGQRLDHQVGMDHARAHHANHAEAGRVLDARNTSQIGAGIGAPVATESEDQRLKVIFHHATSRAASIWALIEAADRKSTRLNSSHRCISY